jgi:Icc-related predicted phosphoesterase
MNFTCISDTHNKHLFIPEKYLTGGDCILHTGDISSRGSRTEVEEFLSWYNELPYKYKVLIAGNHDFFFQDAPEYEIEAVLAKYPNVIYLNDSGVEIEGIKIWGSPVQPYFHGWAFNRKGSEIVPHWDLIPLDTNILLTHGPIYNHLDETTSGYKAGCPYLGEKLRELKDLKLHQAGHIHEAYGRVEFFNGPTLINASLLNLKYEMVNIPIIFDYEK